MTDTRAIIVVKKGELNKFKIVKDQYASPQNVFHISGKTSVDIIASLEKHAPQMIHLLRKQKLPKPKKLTGYLTLIRLLFQINSTSIYKFLLVTPMCFKKAILCG
jgi:hypothetical protein